MSTNCRVTASRYRGQHFILDPQNGQNGFWNTMFVLLIFCFWTNYGTHLASGSTFTNVKYKDCFAHFIVTVKISRHSTLLYTLFSQWNIYFISQTLHYSTVLCENEFNIRGRSCERRWSQSYQVSNNINKHKILCYLIIITLDSCPILYIAYCIHTMLGQLVFIHNLTLKKIQHVVKSDKR